MNELVVGVDGSEHSAMALRWAAAAAASAGVPVRAVQSWVHPRFAVLPTAPVPAPAEEMDEHTEQAFVAGDQVQGFLLLTSVCRPVGGPAGERPLRGRSRCPLQCRPVATWPTGDHRHGG